MQNLIQQAVAEILWHLGVIKIASDQPFKLASGNFSPIYINCRLLISHGPSMDFIAACARWLCYINNIHPEILAGGETAGIPFAAYFASRWGSSMVYVRKKPKDHGLGTLVEGHLTQGSRVLLVEDLITDGESKVGFINSLRDAGAIVTECLCIFDRQQGGMECLQRHGVRLYALTNIETVLARGKMNHKLVPAEEEEIRQSLYNPRAWHESRGLPFKESC